MSVQADTSSSVRQQRFNYYLNPLSSHPQTHGRCSDVLLHPPPLIYHTPNHTLWVFGRDITPPGLSHAPLGPPASCTSSPGVHKNHTPHRIPHPVIIYIFEYERVITVVCYLVSVTVLFQASRPRLITTNYLYNRDTRRKQPICDVG